MTRTIRSLFAKALFGITCMSPLAVPDLAFAQMPTTAESSTIPAERKKSSKELHQMLLKSAGWVRFESNGGFSHGTGGIIDRERRLMITNEHVVEGQDTVWVIFPEFKDGKLIREEGHYKRMKGVKATVIDRDFARDLAVIQLESLPATAQQLTLAADEPDEGDAIRTIGGFTAGGDGLVWGGVHGEVRTVGPQNRRGKDVRHLLSDASTNGGNSGAPVINEAGEVVGVHCAHKNNSINVAMHVSIREVKDYLNEVTPLVSPKTAAALITRGERKLAAQRLDSAIQDFSAAIEKEPTNAVALYLRGKAFTAKNDARTGLEDLNAAIKLEANNYEFRIARGIAFRATGKVEEAMSDFSTAIRSDPSKGDGYNQRGVTHFAAKKFTEAEEDFTRAIEKNDRNDLYYANRAETHMAQKNFDAAAKDFVEASERAPWNQNHVLQLGNALIGAGKSGAAVQVFVEAAKKTGNPIFLSKAGVANLAAGDFKEAVKMYTVAIKAFGDRGHPNDLATAYFGRGIGNRELKNYKEAIDDQSKAIDLSNGKNGVAYLERGRAYRALGSDNAAADDFASAKKLGVQVDVVENAPAVVGVWKTSFKVNGVTVNGFATLKADGGFQGSWVFSNQFETNRMTDTGTWTLKGNKLTIRGDNTGTVVRNITMDGEKMDMELAEFGTGCTWTRVK